MLGEVSEKNAEVSFLLAFTSFPPKRSSLFVSPAHQHPNHNFSTMPSTTRSRRLRTYNTSSRAVSRGRQATATTKKPPITTAITSPIATDDNGASPAPVDNADDDDTSSARTRTRSVTRSGTRTYSDDVPVAVASPSEAGTSPR